MINLARRIIKRSLDILALQIRVALEDFSFRRPAGEHVEHVLDTDPHASDARPSATLVRTERDSLQLTHPSMLAAAFPPRKLGFVWQNEKYALRWSAYGLLASTLRINFHASLNVNSAPRARGFLWLHRLGDQFNRTHSRVMIVNIGDDHNLVDARLGDERLQPFTHRSDGANNRPGEHSHRLRLLMR